MLMIVADYEKLAEWAERNSRPWPKNLTTEVVEQGH